MTIDQTAEFLAMIRLREAELWATKCEWRIKYGEHNYNHMAAWSSVNDLMVDLGIEPLSPADRSLLGLTYCESAAATA